MKERKEILLGSEDIISRDNNDLFVNVDLYKTFCEFKKQNLDNDFDLAERFRKERNASRNFCIYGIVDSTITDSDNLTMSLSADTGIVETIQTTPLAYDSVNVFGKKRGKYIFELNNFTSSTISVFIQSDNATYLNQSFQQQLIFFNEDGDLIDYGTQTVEIDSDGNSTEVNNDFPFFYNKHWIKKDLNIVEIKQREVSLTQEVFSVEEGQAIIIPINLTDLSIL